MRICILSMQRVGNVGSLLQSYSLKKTLEQLGHTVSFLDIKKNDMDDRLLTGDRHRFPKEGYSSGFVSKLKKLDKYTVNRLRMKTLSQIQLREFDRFRSSALDISKGSNDAHYDCCVIGSDEVFNCMSGAKWGFTSQLFGNVEQADRVITYAASSGATVFEELPEAVASRIEEAFMNVSAFSVRDKNTLHMVTNLTKKHVEEHLDPVLVGDFTEELSKTELPDNLPEKYCVVYSYYNRIHTKEEIKAIKDFCRKHDMQIVAVGAPQMWIKKYLVLDPFQVLRVFENAAFVITDTFHGTIFSAKYTNRFATMTRESNKNKLGDMIARLGIESHRVTSFEQLDVVYANINDRNRIAELCERERNRSVLYLKENLRTN